MEFSRFILTPEALQLQARVQAGAALQFTRVVLGSGHLPEGAPQGVIEPRIEMEILGVQVTGAHQATLSVGYSNTGQTEGIAVTELGVYAYDPSIGEILYGTARSELRPGWIAPYSEMPGELQYDLVMTVANAANIEIVDDKSRIYVSWVEFTEKLSSHRHPAASIDESTGETTEEVQRRQDAALESIGQISGTLTITREFLPASLPLWTILDGILTGDKLTTGGAA